MRRARPWFLAVLLLASVVGATTRANAATISYQATDLPDVISGQDLWMYQYIVSDFSFSTDQGFSVYFDATLYSDLQSPPPAPNTDWDVLSVQPDLALPSDGFYDALAVVDSASLGSPFALNFVWLGGAGIAPGSQLFSINQFDADGNISFLEFGQTVPLTTTQVPEPSTLILSALGLALSRRHYRRM